MAYGTRCIHCGWQETDHTIQGECVEEFDISKPRPEYEQSLDGCPGFMSDDPQTEFLTALSEIRSNLGHLKPSTKEEFVSDIAKYGNLDQSYANSMARRIGENFDTYKHLIR